MGLNHQTTTPFRERLGTYALGVAIGCVLVGVLFLARATMQQAATPPAPPGTSATPATAAPATAPAATAPATAAHAPAPGTTATPHP